MAPDCGCHQHDQPTPVEAYWHAVYEIVEWAGQQITVVQPPLPLVLPDPQEQPEAA